jgi:hypothetical protein
MLGANVFGHWREIIERQWGATFLRSREINETVTVRIAKLSIVNTGFRTVRRICSQYIGSPSRSNIGSGCSPIEKQR